MVPALLFFCCIVGVSPPHRTSIALLAGLPCPLTQPLATAETLIESPLREFVWSSSGFTTQRCTGFSHWMGFLKGLSSCRTGRLFPLSRGDKGLCSELLLTDPAWSLPWSGCVQLSTVALFLSPDTPSSSSAPITSSIPLCCLWALLASFSLCPSLLLCS